MEKLLTEGILVAIIENKGINGLQVKISNNYSKIVSNVGDCISFDFKSKTFIINKSGVYMMSYYNMRETIFGQTTIRVREGDKIFLNILHNKVTSIFVNDFKTNILNYFI